LLEEKGQVIGFLQRNANALNVDMRIVGAKLLEENGMQIHLFQHLDKALLVVLNLLKHSLICANLCLDVIHWA
jgi:hypothetical protein